MGCKDRFALAVFAGIPANVREYPHTRGWKTRATRGPRNLSRTQLMIVSGGQSCFLMLVRYSVLPCRPSIYAQECCPVYHVSDRPVLSACRRRRHENPRAARIAASAFPEAQTCCGQPFFNNGFHDESRELAKRFIEVFEPYEYIVTPSGSCCAMVREQFHQLLQDDADWSKRMHATVLAHISSSSNSSTRCLHVDLLEVSRCRRSVTSPTTTPATFAALA